MPARPLHRSVPSGRRYSPTLQQNHGQLAATSQHSCSLYKIPCRQVERGCTDCSRSIMHYGHTVTYLDYLFTPYISMHLMQSSGCPRQHKTLRRSSCSGCCQVATKLLPQAALEQCRKLQGHPPGALNTHLWWGQAFMQVMRRVQSLLSVSWAGWLCRGQPAVASPSGASAGPPLSHAVVCAAFAHK